MSAETGNRRDQLRRATLEEIHTAARGLLVEGGSAAVTVNAVARRVGMSGPALYHYYAGHDELVGAVTAGFLRRTGRRDGIGPRRPRGRPRRRRACWRRAGRCARGRSPTRPSVGWIFASPVAAPNLRRDSVRHQAAQRFEQVLLDLTAELWRTRPFPVPGPAELPASLRDQLTAYSARIDGILPPEAAHVFLEMLDPPLRPSVHGGPAPARLRLHRRGAAFEECLRDLSAQLGLTSGTGPGSP